MKFGTDKGLLGRILEIDFNKQYIVYIDYEGDEIDEDIDDFINLMEV